jgi:hypothetical protein
MWQATREQVAREHNLLEALVGIVIFWCLLVVIFIVYRWVRNARGRQRSR